MLIGMLSYYQHSPQNETTSSQKTRYLQPYFLNILLIFAPNLSVWKNFSSYQMPTSCSEWLPNRQHTSVRKEAIVISDSPTAMNTPSRSTLWSSRRKQQSNLPKRHTSSLVLAETTLLIVSTFSASTSTLQNQCCTTSGLARNSPCTSARNHSNN